MLVDAFGVHVITKADNLPARAGDAARRHDGAASGALAGAAGAAAVGSARQARVARSAAQTARTQAGVANRARTVADQRLARQSLPTGTKGAMSRNDAGMKSTRRMVAVANSRRAAATSAAKTARTAGARSAGLAGAAVAAAGAAAAVHRHSKPAAMRSYGYR